MIHYAPESLAIHAQSTSEKESTTPMRARPLFAPLLLACLLSAATPHARGASRLEADLVVVNAQVRTLDAARPVAEFANIQRQLPAVFGWIFVNSASYDKSSEINDERSNPCLTMSCCCRFLA